MLLSKENLKKINGDAVLLPDEALLNLPEKVLQFGTGVLLRALPDYFIDKANRCGKFNGRIVVVKSTDGGDAGAFDRQDGLYTLCMRGITDGKSIQESVVCSSVNRVLSAATDWQLVLECAANPELAVIISNTTEIGIELVKEPVSSNPPVSYPAKLLAFLYERFKVFGGSVQSGFVIIPTELISDNGNKLKAIVQELAEWNELDKKFINWLLACNQFCNSLVDRIVPGLPDAGKKAALEQELGYQDDLLIMSEVYSLWAIEGNEQVKSVLSFAAADPGVVIADDITVFKELKLRLLNGTHTLSCGVAFLAGFTTVKEAMNDAILSQYIKQLMLEEIAVAIPFNVEEKQAKEFAVKVLDRFSNPSIEHQWISITLNYTAKLKMRVVPVLQYYYKLYKKVPENIATGFAAWLLFMHEVKKEGNNYRGELKGKAYPVKDEMASLFFDQWHNLTPDNLVKAALSDINLWGADLTQLDGFTENVTFKLKAIMQQGIMAVIA
ncbi:tagaturonate reductase [Ferruginibacter paludis]|uniref:tagaturonate reductase n=1 Tax=Ferruginibacter paludis TaxID=1310417 RepID=UPI0025B5EBB7|nr:tagaturonate reductase [Ferruginibacter paludis]MDN3654809.1 tagaturonate reductase [Ferruginibacter paludis]